MNVPVLLSIGIDCEIGIGCEIGIDCAIGIYHRGRLVVPFGNHSVSLYLKIGSVVRL